MADLDTRSKRASSAQLLHPFFLSPPMPDGIIDQGDRQHTAFTYSGILAGAAVPEAPATSDFTTRARRRGRR